MVEGKFKINFGSSKSALLMSQDDLKSKAQKLQLQKKKLQIIRPESREENPR